MWARSTWISSKEASELQIWQICTAAPLDIGTLNLHVVASLCQCVRFHDTTMYITPSKATNSRIPTNGKCRITDFICNFFFYWGHARKGSQPHFLRMQNTRTHITKEICEETNWQDAMARHLSTRNCILHKESRNTSPAPQYVAISPPRMRASCWSPGTSMPYERLNTQTTTSPPMDKSSNHRQNNSLAWFSSACQNVACNYAKATWLYCTFKFLFK